MGRPIADPDLDRRIVMAVFELVARHGVDGLGMRRVAEATGLSTGTINYRFGNKRGLLDAAIDFAYQPPRDFEDHLATTRGRLERLLRRYLLRTRKVRVWWRFYCALVAYAAKDRALARRLERNRRGLVGFFAAGLEAGIECGDLRLTEPATVIAERLVSLAHGLALAQLVDASPEALATAERILGGELDRLLESHDRATLAR